MYIERFLYKKHMATTNQRSIIDIHSKKKKRKSNVTLKRVIKSQEKRTKKGGGGGDIQNTTKTINKMATRRQLSIISINVNELHAPLKTE